MPLALGRDEFGRKKKAAPKRYGYGRYVLMFLAFITGSGGIAGMSEYDWLQAAGRILMNRVRNLHPNTAPTSTADTGLSGGQPRP